MKQVQVDAATRTVRVQGGCTWGEVDAATQEHGLAVPSGIIASTGVAGLTLGGGHGYLTRKYGLTIDNLLEAEVVLADGSVVTASAETNPDLLWALRGGGGNFGIVTTFTFRAHPVQTVYGGPVLWHLDQATEVMQSYREFMATASEDMYGFFMFTTVPPGPPFPEHLHGKTMCGIMWCYVGRRKTRTMRFAPSTALAHRRSRTPAQCPMPRYKACSTLSYRVACNGIGKATSSAN
jgi:hypothetical protein